MTATPTSSALLFLVDGRLPSGGHAHSGGIEAAVAAGGVRDVESLSAFVTGRLATVGLVDAGLAAAACAARFALPELELEAAARCPSPAQRAASRALGRGLVRVARRMWPSDALEALAEVARPEGYLWPVVLGAVVRSAGLGIPDAALCAAHGAVTGPCWAAVRLLGLDPLAVSRVLAELGAAIDATAVRGAAAATTVTRAAALPSLTSPLLEILAEQHVRSEMRLFAS